MADRSSHDASNPGNAHQIAAITYRCATCGGSVTIPHAAAWPNQCPHCKTAPPTLLVKIGVGAKYPPKAANGDLIGDPNFDPKGDDELSV